ncbi:hypothetical protein K1719_045222 [Acacia pycnantha]|nr:hypothetical protein K1719_045222 [Acacia pycnantha]
MSANSIKANLLITLSLLLVASDYGNAAKVRVKKRKASDYGNAAKVRVKNNLEEGQTLTLSCSYYIADNNKTTTVAGVLSGDQVKELSLVPDVTTSVDCSFTWGGSSHLFLLYSQYRDLSYCDTECTWSIKQDRPCRVDPNNSQIKYYAIHGSTDYYSQMFVIGMMICV